MHFLLHTLSALFPPPGALSSCQDSSWGVLQLESLQLSTGFPGPPVFTLSSFGGLILPSRSPLFRLLSRFLGGSWSGP